MSEEKKKSRKKKKSKVAFFITMLIAEMLVLGVIFAYAYALKQYSKIQRPEYDVEEVANTGLSEKKLQEMRGYRNIYCCCNRLPVECNIVCNIKIQTVI